MKLQDVKAVISGGASGLGKAMASYLLTQGASVFLLDINDQAGNECQKEFGEKAGFRQTDVSNESDVAYACEAASEFLGSINVLVNCAGVLGAGRVLGREAPMQLDYFTRTVQINLVGSFNLAKTCADYMQHNEPGNEGERGVIINTASVAAYEGQIGQAAYSASKAGIVGMTLPMAREFTRFGIRVMTIAPGVFHTPMVDGMPDEVQEALAATIPFPSRLGKPDEFAFLAGHIIENIYLNGETIRLDGATRLQAK